MRRPFLGMVLLTVLLSGLFALGVDARFAFPVVALGLAVHGLQVTTLIQPSDALGLLNTAGASLLVLSLAALLLRGVMRSGPVTPNRIVGAVRSTSSLPSYSRCCSTSSTVSCPGPSP